MTTNELRILFETRAEAERKAGTIIEIDTSLGYISLEFSDGTSYFIQGEEAETMFNDVPDWINAEDYFLATSHNW